MNRRSFMQLAGVGAATVVATPTVLTVTGCETSWIKILNADLPTIVSIADTVINLVTTFTGNGTVATTAVATVNTLSANISTCLTTLQALVDSYNSTPTADIETKIYNVLETLLDNLSALLPAMGIKNKSLQTTIASVIAILTTVIQSIKLVLPTTAAKSEKKANAVKSARISLKKQIHVVPDIQAAKTLADAIVAGL